ncbi:hypothetical protein CesoFtcFv8_000982 [Champsocephalus esox]|uniref:Uncharacterized protein n=2 Tax=Champsocephalus TaxID=52236 RepID=A0AAN8E963_CHAGU|nr:hypothetical protein CesoFtcFv8_000982 [Champsocephalus esox]KAK5935339.1 hypothetical protein CgunFtcFv8_020708 [Champsocephalus gunnari]
MRLCFTGTGYGMARHKAVCCGATGRPPPSPPCSGVRRHGEVLQPAAIVNHCKGAKTGCYGISIPPETQG